MTAGKLKEMIAFDRRIKDEDGYGNVEGDWQEQFRTHARVQPIKGGEEVFAGRIAGKQPVIIQIRYSAQAQQITNAWRARDVRTGRTYNITSAADMGENRAFLDVLAISGVGDE